MRHAPVMLLTMGLATSLSAGSESAGSAKRPIVLARYYTWYGTPWDAAGGFGHWVSSERNRILDRANDPNMILFPPAICWADGQ